MDVDPAEPPSRLDRHGLLGPDERATLLIVLVGVLVVALTLAAVIGYIVFRALTEQPRTTVGFHGSWRGAENSVVAAVSGAVRTPAGHHP